MPTYLFELGREPDISAAEIAAVFSLWRISWREEQKTKTYIIVATDTELKAAALMNRLGGTIKIAERLDQQNNAQKTIVDFLKAATPEGKIHFSLSGKDAKKKAINIKKELKTEDRSVRYIQPKNTATIIHNGLVEKQGDFTVVGSNAFVTRAVQDIESFGERDFGRPGRDSTSGMLPPKLARIMINLAAVDSKETILDPFCGSGTVLTEAALMGYTALIGSDLSKKAVADTTQNLDWVAKKYGLPAHRATLLVSDVKNLGEHIKKNSVDAIVTEPYMGKPLRGKETQKQLEIQARDLEALYAQAFKTFERILKPRGIVIFIFPKFRHRGGWMETNILERIKQLGFEPVALGDEQESLLYWRKNQFVGREIRKFQKRT
jgi:tRNA G10  N-methylase Trm11